MSTASDNQRTLNRTGAVIAIGMLMIMAGSIYAFVKFDVPEKNHDVLLILLGALATNISNIINWFFGSSLGAKTKDDTIKVLSATAAQAQDKLAPVPGAPATPTVTLAPNEAVTVKGEDPTP